VQKGGRGRGSGASGAVASRGRGSGASGASGASAMTAVATPMKAALGDNCLIPLGLPTLSPGLSPVPKVDATSSGPGAKRYDLDALSVQHLEAWSAADPNSCYIDSTKNHALLRSISRHCANQRKALQALRECSPAYVSASLCLKRLQVVELCIKAVRANVGDGKKAAAEYLHQIRQLRVFADAEPAVALKHPRAVMEMYLNRSCEVYFTWSI